MRLNSIKLIALFVLGAGFVTVLTAGCGGDSAAKSQMSQPAPKGDAKGKVEPTATTTAQ